MNLISQKFGTHRGLIRTVLADLMWRLGPYRRYGRTDWQKVRRLVFVCQGNICRSPFGHYLAERSGVELPVVSFGLATTTGAPAFDMAIDVAKDYGLDLECHRATDITDFAMQPGDLLIVMEDRHIKGLRGKYDEQEVQICLLGLWCRPRFALLYDPHRNSREYFESCFTRIDLAVSRLLQEYRSSLRL